MDGKATPCFKSSLFAFAVSFTFNSASDTIIFSCLQKFRKRNDEVKEAFRIASTKWAINRHIAH